MADILRITPLKAFTDNYIWVLHNDCHAIVVDPGDAEPVQAFLQQARLQLQAIWITHHHHDHIGGLATLLQQWPGCPVYGPAGIQDVSHIVTEGDTLMALGQVCRVYETPGHTARHVVFHCGQHVFCGDTLFSGGCGRVFDGTVTALHASLQKLVALPDDTLFYPAHEYTLANLQFARALEPDNRPLQQHLETSEQRRQQGLPTLPCSILTERRFNPFLRSHCDSIRAAAQAHNPDCQADSASVFATLRQWKNDFRST